MTTIFISEPIKVLDHGFVRLVDHMGNDLSIIRNARVSYDAQWRAGEDEGSDARLMNYLMKNRHTTPFEAVEFSFEVKAPIFVVRQWHRHRMWSYNELSARYRELPEEFYIPDAAKIGKQSTNNKQMRVDVELTDNEQYERGLEIDDFIAHNQASFKIYHDLIKRGWPRELARSVLPLGTYTHMFGKTDLHNLFHFLNLRLHEHAQYEIKVYAQAMLDLITSIVPVAVAAWKRNRPA